MEIKVLKTIYETTDPKSIKALRGIIEDANGKTTLREIANELINNFVALNTTKKKSKGKLQKLYYYIGSYTPYGDVNFQVAIEFQPMTPNLPSDRLIIAYAVSNGNIAEDIANKVTHVKSITKKEYQQWRKDGV